MSPSRQRLALRRQAQQFFDDHLHRLPTSAAEAQRTAPQAQALARQTGHTLLSAEASLLRSRWLAPVPDPTTLLADLQAATAVFMANQLPHRSLAAEAATALVLYQLGEERHAIAVAQRVLAQPGLAPEVAGVATYVVVLAHGQLGELDVALQWLLERGLPLAQAAAEACPLLPARMAWLHARLWWQVYTHHRHPALWRGLPVAAGLPPVRAALPDAAAVQALASLAERLAPDDPPAAGWARLYQAQLLMGQGRQAQALAVVLSAREQAEAHQLRSLLRDLWLYEARLREALGDSAGALLAFKRLALHRIRSLALLPQPEPAAPAGGPAPPSALRTAHCAFLSLCICGARCATSTSTCASRCRCRPWCSTAAWAGARWRSPSRRARLHPGRSHPPAQAGAGDRASAPRPPSRVTSRRTTG